MRDFTLAARLYELGERLLRTDRGKMNPQSEEQDLALNLNFAVLLGRRFCHFSFYPRRPSPCRLCPCPNGPEMDQEVETVTATPVHPRSSGVLSAVLLRVWYYLRLA